MEKVKVKKTILILILILCFVLTSCTIPEKTADEREGVATGPSGVKETSKGVEEVIRSNAAMSTELKELIDKADTVESLKYSYRSGNDNIWFYVKDNKIKQTFAFKKIDNENYDTVYLDTDKKTAAAYCEHDNAFYCDGQNKQIDVDYNNFILETPFDILELIKSGDVKEGTIVDNKETMIVEIKTEEGYDMKIWLWTYKGIPVKYEIWDDNEKIKLVDYQSLIVNSVSYSDLVHQNR